MSRVMLSSQRLWPRSWSSWVAFMVSPSSGIRSLPEQYGEDIADSARSSLGLCHLLRSVPSLGLVGWVQRLKERNQRGNLSGIQIFAIGRHVAATLDHLPHQLIARHPGSNSREIGATLAA